MVLCSRTVDNVKMGLGSFTVRYTLNLKWAVKKYSSLDSGDLQCV